MLKFEARPTKKYLLVLDQSLNKITISVFFISLGKWELYNVEKVGKVAKIRFQKGTDNLCHVVFTNNPRLEWIIEGEIYELEGWQKVTNRHNVIAIN